MHTVCGATRGRREGWRCSAGRLPSLLFACALLLLARCAHVTNQNQALCASSSTPCHYDPAGGYRLIADKRNDDTLVILTFSGGGMRATALAYGTLAALDQLEGFNPGESLLDDVDLISSVSGGSVTAGWYALRGKEGLAPGNPLENFLYKGATTQLALDGLNPVALTAYAATRYQRSDVLAAMFADRLFGDATYETVEARYRAAHQPYVILNASDVGHEVRFPFTQNRFDLLCSDLEKYKLADAVAASADFPIVFSPIGLRNYSADCPAHDQTWNTEGPPVWINRALDDYTAKSSDSDAARTPPSNGLLELRQARTAQAYVKPRAGDDILHLMDGGLIDNLGIQSPLALEEEAMCSPGLFQRLAQPRPAAYQNIRNVVVIVVNARTLDPTSIDSTVYPPGVVESVSRVIDTPLASSVLDMQNYLTAELEAIADWVPSPNEQPTKLSEKKDCWVDWTYVDRTRKNTPPANPVLDQRQAGKIGKVSPANLKVHIVSIDFELIPNQDCRERFWQMPTAWNLDRKSIDDLVQLPYIMLRRSPDMLRVYSDVLGQRPGALKAGALPLKRPDLFPKDYKQVCSR
jgi:NTE family protein